MRNFTMPSRLDRGTGASALIVSASAGHGHTSAGNALHEAFTDVGYGRVEHVDVLALAPRWVRAAYGGGFELLAARAPRVWREVYERSDGPRGAEARWGPVAHRLVFTAFRRLLRSEPWTVCVCTHFLPAQLAAGLPGHPPFALVITDFALHRYWVQPRVREYFTATQDVARALRDRLPAAQVLASGIPIAQAFARPIDRFEARRRLGLHAGGRVALVMGGGLGMGVEEATTAALRCDVPALQVVAVCGRNAAAAAQLRALSDHRLHVHDYVDGIADFIAAADAVVTKPGGLTCSEALALGRPLVLTRAIPGHEEANVRYLTGRGAALSAPRAEDVAGALRTVLLDEQTARAARAAAAPDAARVIADAMYAASCAPCGQLMLPRPGADAGGVSTMPTREREDR